MAIAVIDANVLVGPLDDHDSWYDVAVAIRDALEGAGAELVYFDCVLNEAISVLARRAHEQRRPEQFDALLDRLAELIPADDITWVSGEIQRLYNQIVELVRNSAGELNFHDALLALVCREQDVSVVVSFDEDFDRVDWLTRVGRAKQVVEAFWQERPGLPDLICDTSPIQYLYQLGLLEILPALGDWNSREAAP